MLSMLLLATWLAVPGAQPSGQLEAVYISHDGDDSLGTQFVAEMRKLLGARGVRVEESDTPDSHRLVVVSIRAVNARTSQQIGSMLAVALLQPDDTFVKMWVYTLNHSPGHARKQAAQFLSEFERRQSGVFVPVP